MYKKIYHLQVEHYANGFYDYDIELFKRYKHCLLDTLTKAVKNNFHPRIGETLIASNTDDAICYTIVDITYFSFGIIYDLVDDLDKYNEYKKTENHQL